MVNRRSKRIVFIPTLAQLPSGIVSGHLRVRFREVPDEDVLGLEIAVDYSPSMQILHRFGRLQDERLETIRADAGAAATIMPQHRIQRPLRGEIKNER